MDRQYTLRSRPIAARLETPSSIFASDWCDSANLELEHRTGALKLVPSAVPGFHANRSTQSLALGQYQRRAAVTHGIRRGRCAAVGRHDGIQIAREWSRTYQCHQSRRAENRSRRFERATGTANTTASATSGATATGRSSAARPRTSTVADSTET